MLTGKHSVPPLSSHAPASRPTPRAPSLFFDKLPRIQAVDDKSDMAMFSESESPVADAIESLFSKSSENAEHGIENAHDSEEKNTANDDTQASIAVDGQTQPNDLEKQQTMPTGILGSSSLISKDDSRFAFIKSHLNQYTSPVSGGASRQAKRLYSLNTDAVRRTRDYCRGTRLFFKQNHKTIIDLIQFFCCLLVFLSIMGLCYHFIKLGYNNTVANDPDGP